MTDYRRPKGRRRAIHEAEALARGGLCPACGLPMYLPKAEPYAAFVARWQAAVPGWQAVSRVADVDRTIFAHTATWDHLLPIQQGGDSSQANLILMCRSCNSEKGSMTVEEWIAWRVDVGSPMPDTAKAILRRAAARVRQSDNALPSLDRRWRGT